MGQDRKLHPQPPLKVRLNSRRVLPHGSSGPVTGRELEERLRSMRHDLRSSIGIIQNTLFLLQEETGPHTERSRKFIRVLQRQAVQMEKILEQNRGNLAGTHTCS